MELWSYGVEENVNTRFWQTISGEGQNLILCRSLLLSGLGVYHHGEKRIAKSKLRIANSKSMQLGKWIHLASTIHEGHAVEYCILVRCSLSGFQFYRSASSLFSNSADYQSVFFVVLFLFFFNKMVAGFQLA